MTIKQEGNIIQISVDDGFRQMKGLDSTGKSIAFASVARAGFTLSSMGKEDAGMGGYETNGRQYTVDQDIDGEDTRFDDYATSDINRVLVHHLLQTLDLGGKKVVLATGLPFQVYFNDDNTINHNLIERKRENLQIKVTPLGSASSPIIVDQIVFAQGLAACIDYVTDDVGNYRKDFDKTLPIAVVDIGGGTTDVVTLLGGDKVDHSMSGTGQIGIGNVYDHIAAALRNEFKVGKIRLVTIENAVRTGKIRFRGEEHDIAIFIKNAIDEVAPQIIREVKRHIGDAAEMGQVLLVGGGALLMEDALREVYPHTVVPKDPEFANARGGLKLLQFSFAG